MPDDARFNSPIRGGMDLVLNAYLDPYLSSLTYRDAAPASLLREPDLGLRLALVEDTHARR